MEKQEFEIDALKSKAGKGLIRNACDDAIKVLADTKEEFN